jgi:fatty-acyl-CoA synthase
MIGPRDLPGRALLELRSLQAVHRAGMIGGGSPREALGILAALQRFGPLGGGLRVAAIKHGGRVGVIDDLGSLTFAELDAAVNRLANEFRARGIADGVGLGVLCRNHRFALLAIFAAARVGARTVYLNTSFAAPQVRDVCSRESVKAIVVDEDLADHCEGVEFPMGLLTGWGEGQIAISDLIVEGSDHYPPKPAQRGGIVMLTSGTTGVPKGAPRAEPRGLAIPGALLDRLPFRAEETTLVCAPLFHATGFAMTLLQVALGSTVVLRRRFEAEVALDDLERHRATGAVLVPILLQRLLALGDDAIHARDLSALRIVFCAGSQLPGELSDRAMDLLGDVVYNLYGSTEVSVATIATPEDLRAAPGCVGRTVLGTQVKLLDRNGEEVPPGQTGRIFVGSYTSFDGYTDGSSKDVTGGLMNSGDVGHFDEAGRLFVDGRDDEMIVSGGENLFPREVEELLLHHPSIDDACAIGVPDDAFGQRLRAFVVLTPSASLDEAAVQSYVKENLARFKVPRDVIFLAELPRNPAGKVLKRELEALALER